MSRESKAGLLMILLLAGVFGFLVYKRMHQPAEVLAQQAATEEQQLADAGIVNEPNDDPKGDENEFAASSRVIHAAATQPAQIPDDDKPSQTSQRTNSVESDPFREIERTAPKVKPKLPTITPSDLGQSARAKTAAAAVPVKSAVTKNVAAKSPSEFDPFAAEEDNNKTTSSQAPQTTTDSAREDTNSTAEVDPFATVDRTPTQTNVPARTASADFGEEASDPFDNSNRQAPDPFEAPVKKSADSADSLPRQQPSSDPFETNTELQAPPSASKNKVAAAQQFDDSPFEPQKPSKPVELQQGIDDAFEEIPAKVPAKSSSVPPLNIPSRDTMPTDTRPAASDDRFGGFKPAAAGATTAKAFPDERPAVPAMARDNERRVARPAPVTQIDEDFAPRSMARPLVAGDTYQIEPGDNYWTISRKKYGAGRYFMALAQHNSKVITDPKRMKPGVVIATPSAATLEQTYPQLIPQAAPIDPIQTASATTATFTQPAARPDPEAEAGFFVTGDGNPMYRVGSEDTLSAIAQRHLGRSSRWVQIFEMNRDTLTDGNSLKIGATLRLPADASRVEVVGGSRTFR